MIEVLDKSELDGLPQYTSIDDAATSPMPMCNILHHNTQTEYPELFCPALKFAKSESPTCRSKFCFPVLQTQLRLPQ